MRPFKTITGRVIPLDKSDVDTDQIIPARHLKRLERSGFGKFAFEAWRADPSFVLNDNRYKDAPFMISGANFGCGSSREHAPWALADLGLRAIIAPSFADIFASNCAKIGLLTIQLSDPFFKEFMSYFKNNPESKLTVDLPSQRVFARSCNIEASFEIGSFTKKCIMEGLDFIGVTMTKRDSEIKNYEKNRFAFMPRTNR